MSNPCGPDNLVRLNRQFEISGANLFSYYCWWAKHLIRVTRNFNLNVFEITRVDCISFNFFVGTRVGEYEIGKQKIMFRSISVSSNILFQYCYKCCYSDSRNLCTVMRAGGLASYNLIQPTISLEMLVPSQGHYRFPSFPVVDRFGLFI